MSLILALLVTIITSDQARQVAIKAAEKAAAAAAVAIGKQAVNSITARRQLEGALLAALATAAVKARTSETPGSEEWWERHGTKVFAPFTDHTLAATISRCAIVGGHRADNHAALKEHLAAAVTRRRRRPRFNPIKRPLYASLEAFGAAHDIDADYFCEILPACVIDAIISAGALPQGQALATQALLAQLTKLTPQLSGLPVAPLSPLQARDEVARWCTRESQRHTASLTHLPYFVTGAIPSDIDVAAMVRVGLRRRTEPTDDPYRPMGARFDAHEGHITSLDEIVRAHQQVVVLGDPGVGKSWALQMRAIRLANIAGEALRTPNSDHGGLDELDLPIAVRCDALAAAGGDLAGAAAGVLAELDSKMTLGLRRWLKDRCSSGKVTFLLDALDETPAHVSDAVYTMIAAYSNPNARIIVTSRIANYSRAIATAGQPCEVELLPFDDPAPYIQTLRLPRDSERDLIALLRSPALAGRRGYHCCWRCFVIWHPIPPSRFPAHALSSTSASCAGS